MQLSIEKGDKKVTLDIDEEKLFDLAFPTLSVNTKGSPEVDTNAMLDECREIAAKLIDDGHKDDVIRALKLVNASTVGTCAPEKVKELLLALTAMVVK